MIKETSCATRAQAVGEGKSSEPRGGRVRIRTARRERVLQAHEGEVAVKRGGGGRRFTHEPDATPRRPLEMGGPCGRDGLDVSGDRILASRRHGGGVCRAGDPDRGAGAPVTSATSAPARRRAPASAGEVTAEGHLVGGHSRRRAVWPGPARGEYLHMAGQRALNEIAVVERATRPSRATRILGRSAHTPDLDETDRPARRPACCDLSAGFVGLCANTTARPGA